MSQSIAMEDVGNLNFDGEFVSTVGDILRSCPRFRILVLGRSGVGKSHLINSVFGTDHTVVQHGRTPGVSNINEEIVSQKNPRLILHDSQGFSHGDAGNFEIVKKFIEERNEMPDLKDRLHAIWLCTEIPTFGSALLEKAEENILRLKDSICGCPIIAVLTKYDILVDSLMEPEEEEDLYGDIEEALGMCDSIDPILNTLAVEAPTIDPAILSEADSKLRGEFVKNESGLKDVPWVGVSVKPNYSHKLDELVKMTLDNIDQSVRILWAITQQQSADLKISASVEVGKRRYWRGLSTGLPLPGRSLERWLKAVHNDIIQIWGLDDAGFLSSTDVTSAFSELQTDLVKERSRVLKNFSAGTVTAVASIISGVAPPAAPFAMSIAVGVIFAAWVYEAVSVTPEILRGMMGYIVDLTMLMQSLFFLIQARRDAAKSTTVTNRFFQLALRAYKDNPDQQHSPTHVHNEIRTFATYSKVFKSGRVIEEIERLIKLHRFKPSETFVVEAKDSTILSPSA